jgi:hypothetical protein
MTSLQLDAGQDADIRRAATFMVERYGRTAVARAARRACVLLLAGYSRAASIWTRIASLAEQLVGPAPQPEATPAREAATNVIPFRIRSPYPSGRVRPNAPSSAGRRVAVGRLIPSLSPSVGTSRSPSPLRS